MTKEAHDVVNLIINDISQDELIPQPVRVNALLDIEETISNTDKKLISKIEGLGLRIELLNLAAKLSKRKNIL